MIGKENMTPTAVQTEYAAGMAFNNGIELYDAINTNENFFIGKQWEGVNANGMPTPVFNFLKRVVLFSVANIATDNLKLHATQAASYPLGNASGEFLADALNEEFAAVFEHNNVTSLVREYIRNAAVDGDGCMYTYWDPDVVTGQRVNGAIKTEILQNTQVLFGNPNCRDVQKQPYIIIERRMLVEEARKRARAYGAESADEIMANEKQGGNIKMDSLGGNKVTVLLRLWRDDETGTVWGYECTSANEIRKPFDLRIKRYPITWMNWDYVQDCYHGQAMITGLIPNQIFVNKLFAMSMISLMTLAYPKIIFDKTRVAHWSNRVGSAIAVNGPVDGVAKIMDPASISPQISQFIEMAIGYTQKFLGASDIALGDTRPDNATAIIALQRAAATPMELTKQNLMQNIEDLGRIYMDFMEAYYGTRMIEMRQNGSSQGTPAVVNFDFLRDTPMSIKLDVGAATYWSEIASMQTLDNLLLNGHISTIEYLKRLPAGMISDRDTLIAVLEAQQQMAPMMGEASPEPNPGILQEEAPEIKGGPGDSALTRAIRKTGEIPEERGA